MVWVDRNDDDGDGGDLSDDCELVVFKLELELELESQSLSDTTSVDDDEGGGDGGGVDKRGCCTEATAVGTAGSGETFCTGAVGDALWTEAWTLWASNENRSSRSMFGKWVDPVDKSLSGGKLFVSSWMSPTHSSQAISESMMLLLMLTERMN